MKHALLSILSNKHKVKATSLLLAFCYLFSCVGPPDPNHGFVENLPAVINTSSAFSFSVRGDKYIIDESINLSLSLQDGKSVASTLIVTDFKSGDTTMVILEDSNGGQIYKYAITGNTTRVDETSTVNPKKAVIQSTKFTGIMTWTVIGK